jgi:hypothetical protein
MIVKTAELTGVALDWVVAKTFKPGSYWESQEFLDYFHPSTDWSQGGPIIEREHLTLRALWENGKPRQIGLLEAWRCDLDFKDGVMTLGKILEYGETPLIAAMRCYVASKLGDEVDIPDFLVGKEDETYLHK